MSANSGNTPQNVDPVAGISAAVGEAAISNLVAAFYRRVATDDLLRPMYPEEDLNAAEVRLREFLIYRCGGPDDYLKHRGHPRLRARHMPFVIDQQARDRWVSLMDAAFEEVQLPEPHGSQLKTFLQGTATFLINRQ
ncbi:globin domain-containing protein [Calycomorphotria hydatis]|uniref:Group 2 truncated hemoglobin GlbO n=1 Tax=Calycomorphotria hydatis TaxID=2528027 RepID=A0A517TC09_9PLAN|nr:globin [Calycomorphotria hydatis]QDT65904.1 Group 2 truncated hemoglobin GlbO [Calycomorphotria hydatis]